MTPLCEDRSRIPLSLSLSLIAESHTTTAPRLASYEFSLERLSTFLPPPLHAVFMYECVCACECVPFRFISLFFFYLMKLSLLRIRKGQFDRINCRLPVRSFFTMTTMIYIYIYVYIYLYVCIEYI